MYCIFFFILHLELKDVTFIQIKKINLQLKFLIMKQKNTRRGNVQNLFLKTTTTYYDNGAEMEP